MLETKEKTLRLKNGTIDCISFGRGAKTMIMIPGLSLRRVKGAGASVAFAYRSFAKEYTVYMFDTRNETDDSCSIEQMADDLYEAMCLSGIGKADVLGVSMGGMIAETLAINHPDAVNSLVIAFSASRCSEMTGQQITHWMELAEKHEMKEMVRSFMESLYSKTYLKKYRLLMPILVKMSEKADLSRFLYHCKAILSFDIADRLKKIRAKTYVIGADKDQITPVSESIFLKDTLGCPYHIYEDLGHGAYEEARDFNERVLKALKGEYHA